MDKFFSVLSLLIVSFGSVLLPTIATYRHLRYFFKKKKKNRNCRKPKALGRCLQEQSVSELKTKSGLQLCSPTRLTRIRSFSAASLHT